MEVMPRGLQAKKLENRDAKVENPSGNVTRGCKVIITKYTSEGVSKTKKKKPNDISILLS